MKTLFAFCALFTAAAAQPDPDEAAYPAIERFVEVLEAVRERHPDLDRVGYERLVNHALEGMLASLDPHSSFIHPEMAAVMKDKRLAGSMDPKKMPFDLKRMSFGGFKTLVEV